MEAKGEMALQEKIQEERKFKGREMDGVGI